MSANRLARPVTVSWRAWWARACSARTCAVTSREMPKVPMIAPVVVSQRQLGRRDPGVRAVAEGLALDLRHHRLAGADDALLVLEGGGGVLVAEEVEVGLADHLVRLAARRLVSSETLADQEEPAVEILEEHPLARACRAGCACRGARSLPGSSVLNGYLDLTSIPLPSRLLMGGDTGPSAARAPENRNHLREG